MFKRFMAKIDGKLNIGFLVKLVLLLLILYLLQETDHVWGSWVSTLLSILHPFLVGFVVAYVLHPLVEILTEHNIKKNLAVTIVLLGFVLAIIVL